MGHEYAKPTEKANKWYCSECPDRRFISSQAVMSHIYQLKKKARITYQGGVKYGEKEEHQEKGKGEAKQDIENFYKALAEKDKCEAW